MTEYMVYPEYENKILFRVAPSSRRYWPDIRSRWRVCGSSRARRKSARQSIVSEASEIWSGIRLARARTPRPIRIFPSPSHQASLGIRRRQDSSSGAGTCVPAFG